LRNFVLVPVQVNTTITSHLLISLEEILRVAISIKSCKFSWPREFLNIVLMLFIEENCLSHSAVDGQKIKVET